VEAAGFDALRGSSFSRESLRDEEIPEAEEIDERGDTGEDARDASSSESRGGFA
jgi:hypothetical protein